MLGTYNNRNLIYFLNHRYAYLALVPVCCAVVVGVLRVNRRTGIALLSIWSIMLVVLGHVQTQHARSIEAILRHGVESWPQSVHMQVRMGDYYLSQHAYAQALPHLQAAVDLGSADPRVYHNLGFAYGQVGKYERGAWYLLKVQELR
jgi:hypothetical protein